METIVKELEAKLNEAIKNKDDFAVSVLLTRLHNLGYKVVDMNHQDKVQ